MSIHILTIDCNCLNDSTRICERPVKKEIPETAKKPPKTKRFSFATNAPKSHVGFSNDQTVHIFGAKLSAPCCHQYSPI